MGWMQKLNEVYDTMITEPPKEGGNEPVLLSVEFFKKPVKYLVTLKPDGTFSSARELTKEEQNCIIPTTPEAETRTGANGMPYPLADQLKYFVCDGADNPLLAKYLEQLEDWCGQPDAPDCLRILYGYLKKRTLLQDMRSVSGLKVKYHKDETEKDGKGADAGAMVCFAVTGIDGDDKESRLWLREDVRRSWSEYAARDTEGETALCYVTGEQKKLLDSHPKILGNAKLISSKDTGYPFQYKGRFSEDGSAATVSAYASIRARNALIWLMEKQGFRRYGLIIVAWNVQGGSLPVLEEENDGWEEEQTLPDTFELYAAALKEAAEGHGEKLKHFQKQLGTCREKRERAAATVILGMEAATDGRMSVNYYQEMDGNSYVQNLEEWYNTCCWEYYSYKNGQRFISTPTPLMIANAVMGADSVKRAKQDVRCKKSDAKKMKNLYKRLLCCIVDRAALPKNVLSSAVYRAEFPLSFQTDSGSWQRTGWDECVRTTCALIRRARFDDKKAQLGKKMQLDDATGGLLPDGLPQNRLDAACYDRDYLYGRLFAVADVLERRADKDSGLPTNAIRMMQFFVQRPAEGWKQLHLKLIPYFNKLEGNASYYQYIIGLIEQRFLPENLQDNASLGENFLLGLFAQTRELYMDAKNQVSPAEAILEYRPSNDRSELFGCLLAAADHIELRGTARETGDGKKGSEHEGNTLALRYMAKFASRPAETWVQIHGHLLPYLENLGVKGSEWYLVNLHKLECCFGIHGRMDNLPLSRLFLHGYYCMRQCLRTKDAKLIVTPCPQKTGNSREQIYAKLLAIENRIERTVLDSEKTEDENRVSNAVRFMRVFPEKPQSIWEYLKERMVPYDKKLRHPHRAEDIWHIRLAKKLANNISELEQQLNASQWNTDEPLNPEWLHFYYVNYYCKEKEGE